MDNWERQGDTLFGNRVEIKVSTGGKLAEEKDFGDILTVKPYQGSPLRPSTRNAYRAGAFPDLGRLDALSNIIAGFWNRGIPVKWRSACGHYEVA